MARAEQTLPRQHRRRSWRPVLWVLLAGILVLAWFWPTITGYMNTGSAVGARLACSCKYVVGRSLSECRRHFEPGMGPVWLTEDAEEKSVTARYLLFSAQTAVFTKGQGCVLERWPD